MSNDNNDRLANDLDRMLQGAFETRPRGGGSSPSMVDVRHRARRHQRRRVGSVVGATAMLGVSGVAVLASRGGPESGIAGDEPTTTMLTAAVPMCGSTSVGEPATTTVEPTTTITWLDTTLPLTQPTTTPAMYPQTTLYAEACIPSGQFRCIGNTGMDDQGYTYFEWCESTGFTTATYPSATMPDYTTYEVLDTTTTFPPFTTTTESESVPITVMATTAT